MTEYDLTKQGTITPLLMLPGDVRSFGDYMNESAVEDLSDNDLPDDEFQRRYNKPMPNPSTIASDMTASEYAKVLGLPAYASPAQSPTEYLDLHDVVEIRKAAVKAAMALYVNMPEEPVDDILVVASKIENFLVGTAELSAAAETYYNEVDA